MQARPFLPIVLSSLGLFHAQSVAQVYRCNVAGAPVYQERPCASTGGTGSEMQIKLRELEPPKPKPAVAAEVSKPTSEPVPVAVPKAPEAPVKSSLEILADRCLDWYRPKLRDPRSAYHRGPSMSSGVLSLDIYATNGFGGYVSKAAACEFKNGAIDDSWTRIHAERQGWK